jgi:trehalose-phosphatase
VPDALLAGTYGIELRTTGGKRVSRVDINDIRPLLEVLKPRWLKLIARHEGFSLEDKGLALALHGRYADEEAAKTVLTQARELATEAVLDVSLGSFRLLDGNRFLEIGPKLADKGKTVDHLLDHYPWSGALPLYLGDDDKDEEAFGVIKSRGGIAILVASDPRRTKADYRLASPRAARRLLRTLSMRLGLLAWKNGYICHL